MHHLSNFDLFSKINASFNQVYNWFVKGNPYQKHYKATVHINPLLGGFVERFFFGQDRLPVLLMATKCCVCARETFWKMMVFSKEMCCSLLSSLYFSKWFLRAEKKSKCHLGKFPLLSTTFWMTSPIRNKLNTVVQKSEIVLDQNNIQISTFYLSVNKGGLSKSNFNHIWFFLPKWHVIFTKNWHFSLSDLAKTEVLPVWNCWKYII